MVYVVPNTLEITPTDPLTTDQLTVTAWIRGDTFDRWCDDWWGTWTKTKIYLYRRNVTAGQTWNSTGVVSTYDCTTQCCLNVQTLSWAPDGNQGWKITFDILNPLPATGYTTTYEFLAVDEGNRDAKPANRTAILTIIVTQDPNDPCLLNMCGDTCVKQPCVICPSQFGCTTPGTTCTDGDYMCQIVDFVKKNPLIVGIGLVAVFLLMSPKKRSGK